VAVEAVPLIDPETYPVNVPIKLLAVSIPVTFKLPPTFKFSLIPTPPATINAPVVLLIDEVVPVMVKKLVDVTAPGTLVHVKFAGL
jgi:hypothetical protein